MKLGKFTIDTNILWKVGATCVTIAGMVMSNKVASNEQMKMREDLKNEVLKELSK